MVQSRGDKCDVEIANQLDVLRSKLSNYFHLFFTNSFRSGKGETVNRGGNSLTDSLHGVTLSWLVVENLLIHIEKEPKITLNEEEET